MLNFFSADGCGKPRAEKKERKESLVNVICVNARLISSPTLLFLILPRRSNLNILLSFACSAGPAEGGRIAFVLVAGTLETIPVHHLLFAYPTNNRGCAKWKLSRNMYRRHCLHVLARLAPICMLSVVFSHKISESELSRKFIKNALLVGYLRSCSPALSAFLLHYCSVCIFGNWLISILVTFWGLANLQFLFAF